MAEDNPPTRVPDVAKFLRRWQRHCQLQSALDACVLVGLTGSAVLGCAAGWLWLGLWPAKWIETLAGFVPGAVFSGLVLYLAWRGRQSLFPLLKVARRMDHFLAGAADRCQVWVELPQAADPFYRSRTRDLGDFLETAERAGALLPAFALPRGWFAVLLSLSSALFLWNLAVKHAMSQQDLRDIALTLLAQREEVLESAREGIATDPRQQNLVADIDRAQSHLQKARKALAEGFFPPIEAGEEAQIALAAAAAELRSMEFEPFSFENFLETSTGLTANSAANNFPPHKQTQPWNRSEDLANELAKEVPAPFVEEEKTADAARLRSDLLSRLTAGDGYSLPDKEGVGGLSRFDAEGRLGSAAKADTEGPAQQISWQEEFQPGASGGAMDVDSKEIAERFSDGQGHLTLPPWDGAVGEEVRAVLSASENFPAESLWKDDMETGVFLADAVRDADAQAELVSLPPSTRRTVQRYFERLRAAK